jgi:hypothetical protein
VSNQWVKLQTKQAASADAKFTSYEATTTGFSIFSITAEKAKAKPVVTALPAPTGAVVQEIPVAPQQPQPDEVQPQQEAQVKEGRGGGLGFASKTLLVIVGLIVAVLVLLEVLHKFHKI